MSALIVLALGLGVGAAMSSAIPWRAMAAHPAPQHEGQLYNVQLDPWPPGSPFTLPGEPPALLTYQDAMALLELRAGLRQVAMFPGEMPLQAGDSSTAFVASVRYTTADFFSMFRPPFIAGSGWSEADDRQPRAAVLSRASSQRLFGSDRSVGRRLRVGGDEFRVAGVLDDWQPLPRYYDITGDPYAPPEDIYLPLAAGIAREQRSAQNNNCWKATPADYAELLRSECVWLNFWVELAGPDDAPRYRDVLNSHAAAEKARGRFPQAGNQRLRSVRDWLESQGVVRSATRVQALLTFAFLGVCVINAMALLLARALAQARELCLHRALGAGRARVLGQCLLEAVLLGCGGALLGLTLTAAGLALSRWLDPGLAGLARFDPAVALAATVSALAAAVLAALLPAWRASRVAPAAFLAGSGA